MVDVDTFLTTLYVPACQARSPHIQKPSRRDRFAPIFGPSTVFGIGALWRISTAHPSADTSTSSPRGPDLGLSERLGPRVDNNLASVAAFLQVAVGIGRSP